MKTLEIKIHTPKPSDELLDALVKVNLKYSTPYDLFYLVWLGDDRYCGVFGDGGNGTYEWFTWREDSGKLEHSDCGWGGTDVALRDVLDKVEPQPEREALREAVKYLKAISKIGGNLPDDRLTNASGPNDARARGLMYISARECANKALAAIEKVSG